MPVAPRPKQRRLRQGDLVISCDEARGVPPISRPPPRLVDDVANRGDLALIEATRKFYGSISMLRACASAPVKSTPR